LKRSWLAIPFFINATDFIDFSGLFCSVEICGVLLDEAMAQLQKYRFTEIASEVLWP